MSAPFCVVESACCEWKDYMVGAAYGPFDEDEAHAACDRLNARVEPYGAVHFTVRPLEGLPRQTDAELDQATSDKLAEQRNFMRDKPA